MFEGSNRVREFRRFAYVAVAILLAVSLVRLGGALQRRVVFPWDLLTCFETPHVAALMKLQQGLPLYGPASDADSEPYPPLTAWLTYAALKPFGQELDIRGARVVAIGFTLLTTIVATWIVARVLNVGSIATNTVRRLVPLIAAAAFLLLHKSMTSDQPHPDNLHILHAMLLLWLCLKSFDSGRTSLWAGTALWAALGILTKQTAAFAPVAVVALLLLDRTLGRRRWLLIALAIGLGALVAGLLFADPMRDFHLRTALGAHAIDFGRLRRLLTDSMPLRFFPRVVLFAFAALGVRRFAHEPALRSFALAWSAIGFFEALPAIAGFLEVGGNYNNLGIIDFWLFLIAAPYLLLSASEIRSADSIPDDRKQQAGSIGALLVSCWFVAALWPTKLTPNEHAYRLGREVEALVREDFKAGRKTWLTAGLAFRIRAGDVAQPRDLGIAVWTLEAAGNKTPDDAARAALAAGIERRLADGYYDRVYDFFPWDLETRTQLERNYSQVAVIRGAGYSTFEEYRGIQPLVNRCTVYERKR